MLNVGNDEVKVHTKVDTNNLTCGTGEHSFSLMVHNVHQESLCISFTDEAECGRVTVPFDRVYAVLKKLAKETMEIKK